MKLKLEKAKTHFPLEKILTVSAGDYVKTQRVSHGYSSCTARLSDYDMKGVSVELSGIDETLLAETFSREVPKDAEVVVDYRFSVSKSQTNHYLIASGTALIRKK